MDHKNKVLMLNPKRKSRFQKDFLFTILCFSTCISGFSLLPNTSIWQYFLSIFQPIRYQDTSMCIWQGLSNR